MNNKTDSIDMQIENKFNADLKEYIQRELFKNGIDPVYIEIRNYQQKKNHDIKEFEQYVNGNEGEIIERNNFEEGYNSRTGSIESFDTLLKDYKQNGISEIEETAYDNLSDEAKEVLKNFDKIVDSTYEESFKLDEVYYENSIDSDDRFINLNNNTKIVQNEIKNLGNIEKENLKNIDYSLKENMNGIKIFGETKDNSYTVINIENFESEPIIEKNIVNPFNNQNNSNEIDNEIAKKLGFLTDDNGINTFSDNQNEPVTINEIGHNKVKSINNYPMNFTVNNKNYKYTVSSTKSPREYIKHIENNNSVKNILHTDLKHSVLKQDQSKNLKTNQSQDNNNMKSYEEFKKEHDKKQTKEQSL